MERDQPARSVPEHWVSPWHPGPVPKECELCGKPAYGFVMQPMLRVCKDCFGLPMLNLVWNALDRKIVLGPRMAVMPGD